jgi:hypothetical protein
MDNDHPLRPGGELRRPGRELVGQRDAADPAPHGPEEVAPRQQQAVFCERVHAFFRDT